MQSVIHIIFFLFFSAQFLIGQTFRDALRFSRFDVIGTARTVGVGGGLGALGTDFGVMSTNPAGIALNRRSEITFTPAIWTPSTRSVFENAAEGPTINKKNNVFFNINSLGFVNSGRSRGFGRTRFNFAIGLNRLADFNRAFEFEGSNLGSITDDFLAIANGNIGADFFNIDPFGTFVATESQAVYQLDGEEFYRTDFEEAPNVNVPKNQRVKERGSVNEFLFGVGANFKEKFMVGLNIGIPSIEFQQVKTYRETDPNDEIPFFEELEFRDSLSTTGTGFNAKLGLIYKVNQALRLGLAVHTPTWFQLDDVFTADMDYSFIENGQIFTNTGLSPEGVISYQLTTPWRVIGSAGYIVGYNGFITAELEFVNYGSNSFQFDDFPADEPIANEEIANELESVVNLRLGGEIVHKIFRFRGGIGLFQSPLSAEAGDVNTTYSAGLGIRQKVYYVDFAYRRFNSSEETYIPIVGDPSLPPLITVQNMDQRSMFMLTLGVRL